MREQFSQLSDHALGIRIRIRIRIPIRIRIHIHAQQPPFQL